VARIAYVDHSYHSATGSTAFLPQLLTGHGHDVDVFWDEAWTGGNPVAWDEVAAYDVVVMFQSYCPVGGRSFRSLHPNVVYIPMYDQFAFSHHVARDLSTFWRPFRGSKVLSFSAAVHAMATGLGIVSHLARYYPEPSRDPVRAGPGLHGFFWLRREAELGWDVVRELLGPTSFDSLHLHAVGDPGFPPIELPPPEDREAHTITVSTWFPERSDFERVVRRANVFFAPRLEEGIGQAFLEAMGRGQCVVAPDNPTMSEYIVHGVNGLLYDARSPSPLDFSDFASLGRQARRGATAGREAWQAVEEALVDFVLAPSAVLYAAGDHQASPGATAATDHGPSRQPGWVAHAARSLSGAVRTGIRSKRPGGRRRAIE
jgi:hypothetical protein